MKKKNPKYIKCLIGWFLIVSYKIVLKYHKYAIKLKYNKINNLTHWQSQGEGRRWGASALSNLPKKIPFTIIVRLICPAKKRKKKKKKKIKN